MNLLFNIMELFSDKFPVKARIPYTQDLVNTAQFIRMELGGKTGFPERVVRTC